MMDGFEWNNNTGSFTVAVTVERSDVSSNMYSVDSSIYYAAFACMPNRNRCTPERQILEEKGAGQYHVVLPAHLEWGASVPVPAGATLTVRGVSGIICLAADSCNGPQGNGALAGAEFLAPGKGMGALVMTKVGGRTYFSVNDRSGATFSVRVRRDGSVGRDPENREELLPLEMVRQAPGSEPSLRNTRTIDLQLSTINARLRTGKHYGRLSQAGQCFRGEKTVQAAIRKRFRGVWTSFRAPATRLVGGGRAISGSEISNCGAGPRAGIRARYRTISPCIRAAWARRAASSTACLRAA